jgi:hypothetical protein
MASLKSRSVARSGVVTESELSMSAHIIPDVLYPAVANIMLDGSTALSAVTTGPNSSTVTSSKYGTVQADGRMYYYTDIKGSKPIKDPRIGAHFGSQRHKFKSLQLLEQETATHGEEIKSIDGREWIRTIGDYTLQYNINGSQLYSSSTSTPSIEITGYFSSMNLIGITHADTGCVITIDGVAGSEINPHKTTVASPLGSRYVDRGSVANIVTGQTLGIHTIKITDHANADENYHYGIELIAQDTTSTATRSQIQIPSQNVVSYGKKFTVAGTPHYNPFAFAGDGTTAVAIGDTTSHGKVATGWTGSTSAYFDSTLDTATSLGLSAWETGGDFYRPINGGRVVRWVDSSGNIKTSVNMMPPTGTSIGVGSDAALPTSHAWTTVYQPKFSSTTIDHSQAEVAKTFHYREFGNGAANGGTLSATYADASMLNTYDDCAYVMDDGLTSLSCDSMTNVGVSLQPYHLGGTAIWYLTFIGTGITIKTVDYGAGTYHVAQNLPYGTHILSGERRIGLSNADRADYVIDGVAISEVVGATYASCSEATIHQPKMPPIPEDAVVIADYMLMADFVPQTAAGAEKISKGVRKQSISRDCFFDETDGDAFALTFEPANFPMGLGMELNGTADSATSATMRIPSFGTNYVHRGYQSDTRAALYIDTTDNDSAATKDNTAGYGSYAHLTSDLTLGVYKFGANAASGQRGNTEGFDIATPIHTSSHYQTFETPFLHELVGGDRNMEQTNLVVTPDGKTWDEITRDTSYIGKGRVSCNFVGTATGLDALVYMDDWRGVTTGTDYYNKDFAIAYDRFICLVPGNYTIVAQSMMAIALTGGNHVGIYINGLQTMQGHIGTHSYSTTTPMHVCDLQRGDYVQLYGRFRAEQSRSGFYIERN